MPRLRVSTRWLLLWPPFREVDATSMRRSDRIFSLARPTNDASSEYSFNFRNRSFSHRISSFSIRHLSFCLRTVASNSVRLSLPCMRESFGVSLSAFCFWVDSSSPVDCEPLRCDEGVGASRREAALRRRRIPSLSRSGVEGFLGLAGASPSFRPGCWVSKCCAKVATSVERLWRSFRCCSTSVHM